jgi:lysophospholipase L1-like esterase
MNSKPPVIKRILLSLVSLVLSLLLLEGGVRALLPHPLTISPNLPNGLLSGEPYLEHTDRDGGWIRARAELSPWLFIPEQNTEGELRVAMLGGSTVETAPPFGPAWQLAALLQAGSGGQAHMIAAGGKGFGSARILPFLDELLDHDPDAVVLYTGHNEFNETRSLPELDLRQPRRAFLRRLRSRLWAMTYLENIHHRFFGVERPIDPSFLEQEPISARERALLDAAFQRNLEAMASKIGEAGIPAVWVLPASNPAREPRGSLPSPGSSAGARVEEELARARAARGAGHQAEAARQLRDLLARHPEHAGAWFDLARCLEALGDREGAREALDTARDNDALPNRATRAQRRIVGQVAAAQGQSTVDARALLEADDGQRYWSGGYSPDAMHLDTDGYRLVAIAVYRALAQAMPERLPFEPFPAHEGGAFPALDPMPNPHGEIYPQDHWQVDQPPLPQPRSRSPSG